MTTITALVGDYYHEEAWAVESLEKAVAGLNCTLEFITAEQIVDALARRPDTMVLFKEDRLKPAEDESLLWMTADVQLRIDDYVRSGGSWLGWHSGLASYNPLGDYVGMLRGHFLHHPREHQAVCYTSVENALGLGLAEPFEIVDEHYFVKVEEAITHVFARSSSVDGVSIAGWAHEHGLGRVCCFTPAHRYEGLQHDSVVATLGKLLRWCLKR